MELFSMLSALPDGSIDNLLIWTVAIAAGLVGLVAVANVLDMFFEAETR
jgi:hypothetical protein